ncbi:MAG: chromosome segregation protein SMC [candidate division KSB1 bacterium]|jgi:chromosome segregation protein|nr:chromosome segregation protein SMC [candidate division KSB1 bacterium]
MYLSQVDILGFKSFAKKATLVFNPGITAIVGPNGAGKSNIVDAIRWVLGEQKAGVLRSDKMENVIFAGSKAAKPLGMAEVSLTIQNTRNVLPIEYSEVVVTRRLFRSGESQYLLNGTVCRLKDINDLFMDTGMGPDAYSVIELSMVESLLNGKAEERRRVFDEAAGITKYKQRRKATYRKLEATEKDLQRLEDIISEVEKTVRSLQRQVHRAQRYERIAENLRELEIKLATKRFTDYGRQLTPLLEELTARRQEREAVSAQLGRLEAALEEAKTQLIAQEQELRQVQQHFNQAVSTLRAHEEEVLVGREQMHSLESRAELLQRDAAELQRRLEKLQTHLAEQQQHRSRVEQLVAEAQQAYEQARARHQEQMAQVATLRQEYQTAELKVRDHERQLAELRTRAERATAQKSAFQERAAALAQERARNEQALAEIGAELATQSHELARLEGAAQQTRTALQALQEQLASLRQANEQLRMQQLDTQGEMERARHRAEILRRLLQSYEDQPESVRLLVSQPSESFRTLGTLADMLAVDEQYRPAIEAVLGEALNFVVVADQSAAFRGVAILRAQQQGPAWFVPLADMRPRASAQRSWQAEEILAWADELVTCDAAYRPLAAALLGSTAVVKDLEVARRLHTTAAAHGCDLVTLSGERLTAAGLVRGGQVVRQEVSLIGRRQQLEQATAAMNALASKMEGLRQQAERQASEMATLSRQEDELRAALQSREADIATYRLRVGQLEERARNLGERQRTIATEEEQLRARSRQVEQELARQQAALAQLSTQGQALTAQAEHLREQLREVESTASELATEAERLHIALVSQRRDLDEVVAELSRTEAHIAETQQAIATRADEARQAKQQAAALSERITQLKHELQESFAKRDQLEHQVLELEERYRSYKQQIDEQERACRDVRIQRERLAEAVHQLELQVTELQLKINNLKERARVEFEVELSAQDIEDLDVATVEQEISTLRQKLKLLGPVNLLALREYEQEKARLDLLLSQRKDLLDARANLEETIRRINQTAREKFAEVFQTVHQNFKQVFAEFFAGGTAEVRLEEGDDPLEAEIKIVASPKGKRMESLSLLSGGEKALTAISLLFAIYLVKPSPFCILDEVDAPLDDVNVHRFVQALRKFTSNTQFITVTHNKITMKAADYLYGVTMSEDHISRLVSVRFGEQETAPEARNAAAAES